MIYSASVKTVLNAKSQETRVSKPSLHRLLNNSKYSEI